MTSLPKISVCCGLLLLSAAMSTSPAIADEPSQRYFEALRERRLWSLAELVCLDELKNLPPTAPRRMEVVLELTETFAAHARDVSLPAERQQLWEQAAEVLDTELRQTEVLSHRLALAVQRAGLRCDERAVLTMLAAMNPYDELQKQHVIDLTSKNIVELNRLDETLAVARFPAPPATAKDWFDVSARQLQRSVQLKLAEELFARALSQPATSPDRADDFLKAEQIARKVSSGPREADGTQRATLLLTRIHRLRGDWQRAKGLLDSIDASVLVGDLRDEVLSEQAELLIAQDKLADAADLLRKAHQTDKTFRHSSLLLITTLTRLSQAARQQRVVALADELLAEADRSARPADGGENYWSQRAQQAVAQAREDLQFGAETATLIREGRGRYAAGDREQAAAVFTRAYEQHLEKGPSDDSFEIGLTRARLLVELKQFEAALKSLDELLTSHSSQAARPQADLLRVICLGRLYQAMPGQAAREKLTAALEAHVRDYPDSPTKADAQKMLDQLKAPLKPAPAR